MIINASELNKFGQALLSLGIRIAVIGAVAGLDYLMKVYTGFNLPDPAFTIPTLGLIISESDSWLVQWEKENIPTV